MEAVLQQKVLQFTQRHFAYEALDKQMSDAMKRLEVIFSNAVMDCAIQSLHDRFETLGDVKDKFAVFLNFRKLDPPTLSNKCDKLQDPDMRR